MDDRLPEELKPYADAIDVLGWVRFIPKYAASTPEQQQVFRKAVWEFSELMQAIGKENGIEDQQAIVELFRAVLPTPLNPYDEGQFAPN